MKNAAPHRWTIIGDLLVSYTTSGAIPDELWDAFNQDMKTQPITKYLSTTVGDIEVTSTQRKSSTDIALSKKITIAVVTDARLVRGMVTAVSWFGVDIKPFSWNDLRGALEYLKVQQAMADRAVAAAERFKRGEA